MSVQMRNTMGVLEQNRERERSEKKERKHFTTDQTIGHRCCWVEIKREKEWERLRV